MAIFGQKPDDSSEDSQGDAQRSSLTSASPASTPNPYAPSAAQPSAAPKVPGSPSTSVLDEQRPSVISEGFEFVGEIRGKGPLTVDGSTEGIIEVGSLVIGVTGRSQGQITAKSINIKGRLSGSVDCDELLIGGRAEFDGDVTYGSLTIQRGALVRGELKRK